MRNVNTLKTDQYRLVALFLLCPFLLAGCALVDEGAIDYRKTELLKADSPCDIDKFTKGHGTGCQDNDELFGEDGQLAENVDKNKQSEALRIARLARKNVLHPKEIKDAKFRDGDKIVIRLVSAYIADYTEGPFSWVNDIGEGQFLPRGEIAVAVKVTDIPDNGEGQKFSFDFSDSSIDNAKIVFYSGDVVEKQFLNFNNMPIYGPDSTKLDAIGIEIWIMELDISGKLTGDLLGVISSLGENTFPEGSPGNAIVKSLGATVTNFSSHNDTNFLYRLLLEDKKDALLPHAALEVGHYVLIRDGREEGLLDDVPVVGAIPGNIAFAGDINWSELVLDENSGRVHKKVGDKYEEYRDRSYLVISIDKDNSGPDLEITNKTYAAFVESLEKQSANPFIAALVREFALRKLLKTFDEYYEARKAKETLVEVTKDLADTQKDLADARKDKGDKEAALSKARKIKADVEEALTAAEAEKSLVNAKTALSKVKEALAGAKTERYPANIANALANAETALGNVKENSDKVEIEKSLENAEKSLSKVKKALDEAVNEKENSLTEAEKVLAEVENKHDAEAKKDKIKGTLLIKFTDFWDRYINYSLNRHLTNEKINDNDLTQAQLNEIANDLQVKIKEGMDTNNCRNYLFSWFSETENETKKRITANSIREGLVDLVTNDKCTKPPGSKTP